mgnify:CR=1 FL=1
MTLVDFLDKHADGIGAGLAFVAVLVFFAVVVRAMERGSK